MKMTVKNLLMVFLLAFILGTVLGPVQTVEAKSVAYQKKGNKWVNGKNTIYMKGKTLYKATQSKKAAVLAKFLNKDPDAYCNLLTVYGDYAFVEFITDINSSTIYSVNIKTGAKQKNVKKAAVAVSGKYIWTCPLQPTDVSSYRTYIYEIKGSKLKKIKKVGKYISGPQVYENRIYYASYTDSPMKKMTVYSCKANGTSKKKLFSLKAKGEEGMVHIGEIKKGKIDAYVYSDDRLKQYQYTIKSKKIKIVSERSPVY